MDPSTDDALIRRIASGDRGAMQALYARHHVRVYRFLVRQIGETGAEDLISDVFFDVWQQAGRFEGRSSVTTWLLSIARFKAISSIRKRREAALEPDFAEAIEDEADTPEVVAQKTDKAAALRRCLERLSPDHREVVDLVYYHERSVEEAAEVLGVPEGTVKTRLFHARKRLSELLQAAGIDRGWP
jgi:RNA polymerase sigma-70 factor (ECF subfamily)